MTSLGIIAHGNKEVILEAINDLKKIPGLTIIFIKQSEEKLYVVTDRAFSMEENNDN